MVISSLVREIANSLSENARFEAELIVMYTVGIDRTQLTLRLKDEVGSEQVTRALEMAKRRAAGEPLQYILGETEFMSLEFYVEDGVLIPRQDTETLVETVLSQLRGAVSVIDICSGSGCVGISAAYYNKDANVVLADISDKAIEVSERNIARHGLANRVKTTKADILRECPDGRFDAVVSNPPYIETAVIDTLSRTVKDYEPREALDGGADGLVFYRRITQIAPKILKDNGLIAFEIGYDQGESVRTLLERDFCDIRIIKDLGGNDRVVTGHLKEKG